MIVLLIVSEARQPKGSMLVKLKLGQHFFVAILDGGGYKVHKTGIYRESLQ